MFRVFIFVYSVLYTLAVLVCIPIPAFRWRLRGHPIQLLQRIGRVPDFRPWPPENSRLWVHAVSVGEVNAVSSLVNSLDQSGYHLFVSTTTPTGKEQAIRLFEKRAKVFYFPLDWKLVHRRFLRQIRPAAVLLVETELWPNFITCASRMRVPVLLINGRISDKSFGPYKNLSFLMRLLLTRLTHFCMQSQPDLDRIVRLGAPIDRVSLVGNLKFDFCLSTSVEKEALRKSIGRVFKADPANLLLICASTKPGEEKLIIPAFARLSRNLPSLRLLIAPRHPHRGNEVAQLLNDENVHYLQRSKANLDTNTAKGVRALVLDSLGELAHLYEVADLVFMGGSLVATGGQNPIEAAAAGKPILFGPSMSNFREIAKVFVEAEAAIQVASIEEWEIEVENLIRHPEVRHRLGRNAAGVIKDHQGAVARTVEIVGRYVDGPGRGT